MGAVEWVVLFLRDNILEQSSRYASTVCQHRFYAAIIGTYLHRILHLLTSSINNYFHTRQVSDVLVPFLVVGVRVGVRVGVDSDSVAMFVYSIREPTLKSALLTLSLSPRLSPQLLTTELSSDEWTSAVQLSAIIMEKRLVTLLF